MEKEKYGTYAANLHKVLQVRFLTENTFVLRMERRGMEFRAGQHIIVGPEGELDQREYSIYSGENDDYLEILVREVPDGKVSIQLRQSKPGQLLQVNGPYGSFCLEKYNMFTRKHVFVASGTGISPFHSFVRSYPGIDYLIFHGVRFNNEGYEKNDYDPSRYILCTSRDAEGENRGRVTQILEAYPIGKDMLFFLCGNNSMIREVRNILINKGLSEEQIFSEIYF